MIGLNSSNDGRFPPAEIAATGTKWVRAMCWPAHDITGWLSGCKAVGLKVLLGFDMTAVGDDDAQWRQRMAWWRDRYGVFADAWQIGNEQNHQSPSSWSMSAGRFTRLLRDARAELGPSAFLVAGGIVGDDGYLDRVDLSPVNAIAAHPYGCMASPDWPHPGWGAANMYVGSLIRGLERFHKPLWITEVGLPIMDGVSESFQAEYCRRMLRSCVQEGAAVAMWFSYHDDVTGHGLIRKDGSRRLAWHVFKDVAGTVVQPPPPQPGQWTAGPHGEWIGQGLLDALNRKRWTPLGGEEPFGDGWPAVTCVEGLILWDGRRGVARPLAWEAA
jgi:hypothetical protein